MFQDVRAVLFDFDGTLAHLNIDFRSMTRMVHKLMAQWGLNHSVLKEEYVLEQIQEAAEHLGSSWSAFRVEAMEMLHKVEMKAASRGELLPGVPWLLDRMRQQGIKVGVLTRNCRDAVLSAAPALETYCDSFVPRDDLPRVKPHPDHLRKCMAQLEVDPPTSLMVGDHVIDILVGARVGMRTVGVLTGNTSKQALEDAGADLILEEVTQLAFFIGLE